jgi:hypothetical protein
MTATIINYVEKTPRWHLVQQILKRSESKEIAMAVKEWKLTTIERSELRHTCLCTHYPIKELCHLYNSKTHERVIVGNCCVRLFDSVPTNLDSAFLALARGKVNKSLIDYAYENGIIDDWEYNFSCATWRKRILSHKQRDKREAIAKKILKAFGESKEINMESTP